MAERMAADHSTGQYGGSGVLWSDGDFWEEKKLMARIIKERCGFGHELESELHDFVANGLDGGDIETGALEAASWTAQNCAKAIGKLVDMLFEKGVLTIDEVKELAGERYADIRVKEASNE
jgi:hypothetical protein